MLWGASPKLNTKKKYSFLVTKIRAQGRASKSKKTTGVRKNKTLKGTVQNPNGKFPMDQDSRVSFNREREREVCMGGFVCRKPMFQGNTTHNAESGKGQIFPKTTWHFTKICRGGEKTP